MGRPLIYICAVTLIVLGLIQINLNNRHIALAKRTATYANEVEARNMAHSGVEVTLNRLRDDPTWRNNYKPYSVPLDYGTASVMIQDNTTNPSLGSDELRLESNVPFQEKTVMVAYRVQIIYPELPNIPAALTITDDKFLANLYGSFDINGNDESGTTDPILGISVMDTDSETKLMDGTDKPENITGFGGSPSVDVNQTVDFDDVEYLIDQLAPNATYLNGQYTTNLGSPGNPGVFFVKDYAKITSNVNGYGILVVRKTGDLDIATLDLKGTFNFYGLVVFENAWSFQGQGTATIHGSVLVGSPDGSSDINIEIGGNLQIYYNQFAMSYAEEAAKMNIPATFKVVDIYE